MINIYCNKRLLASSVALAMSGVSVSAIAAEELEDKSNTAASIEVINVTGIRASSKASINLKRFAGSQVDGISAEDIGKLPDVTIADSLQRITGVQITRTAGEGGVIAIRGLPQVGTTLNGETFLSATTIDSSGADYSNLPSQLFSGVDVYKSAQAKQNAGGISGSVNLQTRRPLDFEQGYTFFAGGEVTRGSISKKTDPNLNALATYTSENFGALFAVVTSKANLATDYNGYFDTSENGGIGAANNNHTWGENSRGESIRHVVPQGFAAFNKQEERNRDAFQLTLQADLGEGFEMVFDAFYTDQERFNRRQGLSQNNRWNSFNEYAYPNSSGFTGDTFVDEEGHNWAGINSFDMASYRLQTFTQVNNNEESSQNYNLELNYDNGEALTGQVRMTRAKATARMRHGYGEGDILSIDRDTLVTGPGQFTQAANCTSEDEIVGDNGGCYADFSPGGIEDVFTLSYDASGEHPVFSGFDQIVNGGAGPRSVAAYMADVNSYHIGAFSSEGNTDNEGTLDTFSTKWNYAFEDYDYIASVDFGARVSQRKVDHDQFTYTSNFADDCDIAQWKAVDQYFDTEGCEGNPNAGEYLTQDVGDLSAGSWVPYTILGPTPLDRYTDVSFQTNFGSVAGVPGMWAIDPSNFNNPRQFHQDTFGNVARTENGGATYDVALNESSYFTQLNFEHDIVSGNAGLRVNKTDLYVKQNLVGASLPHSGLSPDVGDQVTERSYTDYLPSLNIAVQATEDIILRAAYSKNMQALDLSQWGGGKTVGRVNNEDCNCLRVVNGTLTGNPGLNPWRSENVSLSAELYTGNESMFFLSVFKIDIESFTEGGTVMIDEPDTDGISRGPWPFSTQVQGVGGNVQGFEIGGKLALNDFIDVPILNNMGLDVNYTYNDSKQQAKDVHGKDLPFVGMSKDTYNFVLWYEQDEFSTRLAWNSVSPRLITHGTVEEVGGQSLYQDTYSQLDFNASYNISEDLSVYVNGSNILKEYQQTYLEFESQKAFQNIYEARWTTGLRMQF